MADLSQLSDEQLSVYRDLVAKKAGGAAPEQPQSYLGKLASNIPASAGKAVSSTVSAYRNNQPNTLPPMAEGEDPDKPFYGFRQVGKNIANAASKVLHFPTTLQEDPVGTVATIGQGISAARGGIGKTAIPPPSEMAESAMSRVPQGFNIMHPDVRQGVGKMAAGAAVTEAVPGPLKWPVRTLTMYPGARQAYRGMVKPEAYAQEALGELPTIKSPVGDTPAGKPPAVFGDPEGFSKLPANVQEAILRGGSSPSAAPKPAPYTPRSIESYGITPTPAISNPAARPSITVPAQGAADVVGRVEHPPFAPDRPFPTSQKMREQTPAAGNPELDSQVERLRKAFPWETDQQLRARAGHSSVMNKLESTPGALEKMKQLKQSLGGK